MIFIKIICHLQAILQMMFYKVAYRVGGVN